MYVLSSPFLIFSVQEAYDCLGDTEKRLQYDLKLTGVQYDQIPTDETSKENRYMRSRYGTSVSFNMFMKSKRFKMHFTAQFQKPKVPDIVVNLDIELQVNTLLVALPCCFSFIYTLLYSALTDTYLPSSSSSSSLPSHPSVRVTWTQQSA